jgi:hypothetical protein
MGKFPRLKSHCDCGGLVRSVDPGRGSQRYHTTTIYVLGRRRQRLGTTYCLYTVLLSVHLKRTSGKSGRESYEKIHGSVLGCRLRLPTSRLLQELSKRCIQRCTAIGKEKENLPHLLTFPRDHSTQQSDQRTSFRSDSDRMYVRSVADQQPK